MPVAETTHYHLGTCPCCGNDTACTRRMVSAADTNGAYLCKWTPGNRHDGMAWLISTFDSRLEENIAVGLWYSFEHRGFMIQNVGGYSWSEEDLQGLGLCDRTEIVDTELAATIFALADEIWLCDPYVIEFVQAHLSQA